MVHTIVVFFTAQPGKESALRAKLAEAAAAYKKDSKTFDWHVMQDPKEPTRFCVVERYDGLAGVKEHTQNPYFKTFGPGIKGLIARAPELHRYDEFESAKL